MLYPTPPAPRLRIAALLPLLVAVVLGVLTTWSAASPAQAQVAPEGNVRLSPASSQVHASDGIFTVYVVLEGLQHSGNVFYDDNRDGVPDRQVPSEGLGAFEFTIKYEDSIVEYVDAEAGPNLNATGRSFQCLGADLEPDSITFGCLSPGGTPAGPQGTLTLAAVQFRPVGNGLSPLVLEVEVAGPLGDSTEVTLSGGTARVSGASSTAPTDTPDEEDATSTQEAQQSGPVATEIAATALSATQTQAAGGGATPDATEAVQTATAEAEATARATDEANATPDGPDGGCIEGEDDCGDEDGGSDYTWVWVTGAVVALSAAGLGLGGLYLRGRP